MEYNPITKGCVICSGIVREKQLCSQHHVSLINKIKRLQKIFGFIPMPYYSSESPTSGGMSSENAILLKHIRKGSWHIGAVYQIKDRKPIYIVKLTFNNGNSEHWFRFAGLALLHNFIDGLRVQRINYKTFITRRIFEKLLYDWPCLLDNWQYQHQLELIPQNLKRTTPPTLKDKTEPLQNKHK